MARSRGERAVVGVDLGGTSIYAVVIDARDGRVLGAAKRKTEAQKGADAVAERVSGAVEQAIAGSQLKRKAIRAIGVGVPGPVDPQAGVVVRCPNLGPSWDSYPLVRELGGRLDLPVTLDNDVNVGAVGEHTYGAGKGTQDMLAIFVGTGIGGGLILGGQLYTGVRYSAGEVGHMVIADGGPLCGCGEAGHAEALASRTAIERDIRAAMAAGRESIVSRLLEETGRDIMTASILGDAYDAGDEVTVSAIHRAQYYLGLLVSACVNLLDPEMIVLGGGLLERMGDAYLEPVRRTAQQHYINKTEVDRVAIVRASLGDRAGAIGAAVLALQRLKR